MESITEKEIDRDLNMLKISPTQRKILKEKCEIMSKILDMASLPLRGFFAKALVEWQQMINSTVDSSEKQKYGDRSAREDRIKESNEIFEMFKDQIRNTLKAYNKDHLLDDAVKAAQKHYLDNYATRDNN